jgi:acetyl-CoA C-acetyltransferase
MTGETFAGSFEGGFIAGAGQRTWRSGAPDPGATMAETARLALEDAAVPASDVELIACVEPLSWNYSDLEGTVAEHLSIDGPFERLWVPAGGTSPQDLLHQVCARIAAGELDCALICGSESMRTRRAALRQGGEPEGWPERATDVNPLRGQKAFTSEVEQRHGLRAPMHAFPLFENAIRAATGRSESEQVQIAAELLARNAAVAADNPHAWFQDAPGAEEIGTVTADNRLIAYPYTKRMNAIMDVDQAAAILVVSGRFLGERGGLERAAAVLGGTGVEEIWNPIERTTFERCPAMERAIDLALARAGTAPEDLAAMDLYSCFPSPIQFALAALGTDTDDPRPLSLTGGLAFAGGPGNAYVLHSLAAALDAIRRHPEERVLVTGIGMANTKHAATVLTGGGQVPEGATGETSYREPLDETPRTVAIEAEGHGTVCTYTIEYDREGTASKVIVVLDLDSGERAIANMTDPVAGAEAIRGAQAIGRTGTVAHDADRQINIFAFD